MNTTNTEQTVHNRLQDIFKNIIIHKKTAEELDNFLSSLTVKQLKQDIINTEIIRYKGNITCTALFYYGYLNQKDYVEVLLKHGAYIDQHNSNGDHIFLDIIQKNGIHIAWFMISKAQLHNFSSYIDEYVLCNNEYERTDHEKFIALCSCKYNLIHDKIYDEQSLYENILNHINIHDECQNNDYWKIYLTEKLYYFFVYEFQYVHDTENFLDINTNNNITINSYIYINKDNKTKLTPLGIAIITNNIDALKMLYLYQAHINKGCHYNGYACNPATLTYIECNKNVIDSIFIFFDNIHMCWSGYINNTRHFESVFNASCFNNTNASNFTSYIIQSYGKRINHNTINTTLKNDYRKNPYGLRKTTLSLIKHIPDKHKVGLIAYLLNQTAFISQEWCTVLSHASLTSEQYKEILTLIDLKIDADTLFVQHMYDHTLITQENLEYFFNTIIQNNNNIHYAYIQELMHRINLYSNIDKIINDININIQKNEYLSEKIIRSHTYIENNALAYKLKKIIDTCHKIGSTPEYECVFMGHQERSIHDKIKNNPIHYALKMWISQHNASSHMLYRALQFLKYHGHTQVVDLALQYMKKKNIYVHMEKIKQETDMSDSHSLHTLLYFAPHAKKDNHLYDTLHVTYDQISRINTNNKYDTSLCMIKNEIEQRKNENINS
jgi:hypothetical protein